MEIQKYFLKGLADYAMLQAGDSVLIGASGGKDSMTLGVLLAWLVGSDGRYGGIRLEAVHVSGGGAAATPPERIEYLADLYKAMRVPFEVVEIPDARPARSCYRCATLRRQALLRVAVDKGCNRLALGHHLDDILVTALMGLVRHGSTGKMLPVRRYASVSGDAGASDADADTIGTAADATGDGTSVDDGATADACVPGTGNAVASNGASVTLIRPLVYVPEESIRRFALAHGWDATTCSCPAGTSGERSIYRQRLEVLTGGSLAGKRKLLVGLGFGPVPSAHGVREPVCQKGDRT